MAYSRACLPDVVKNCLEGGGSMSPFQPLVYIRDLGWINRLCESRKVPMRRFMRRKREFFGVIWQCFARAKCGNITSSFRKCCDCRESHLLCDLPKALTYKTQVCGWARVTRILCAKDKNTSWVFSQAYSVLKYCGFLIYFCRHFAMGLMVWLTKRFSNVKTNLKQGAHIHQPTAWPVTHKCAQPYHPGSDSHEQLFRPYWGSSAWHSRRTSVRQSRLQRLLTAEASAGPMKTALPCRGSTAMPCWWAEIRAKQLSMSATAWVIWLCACVSYWPGRGLVYVCPML